MGIRDPAEKRDVGISGVDAPDDGMRAREDGNDSVGSPRADEHGRGSGRARRARAARTPAAARGAATRGRWRQGRLGCARSPPGPAPRALRPAPPGGRRAPRTTTRTPVSPRRRAGRRTPASTRQPNGETGSSTGARRPRRRATARRRPACRLRGHVPRRSRRSSSRGVSARASLRAAARGAAARARERPQREPDERRGRGPAVGRRRRLRGRAPRSRRRPARSPPRRARAGGRTGAGSARSVARRLAVERPAPAARRAPRACRPTCRWPNSVVGEVAEVERPGLGVAELVGEDRVHRPADDRRLDLRARVDPDDRGAVVDRVEVVLPRLARRAGTRRARGQIDDLRRRRSAGRRNPRCGERVRPDEDARVAQRRRGRGPPRPSGGRTAARRAR